MIGLKNRISSSPEPEFVTHLLFPSLDGSLSYLIPYRSRWLGEATRPASPCYAPSGLLNS